MRILLTGANGFIGSALHRRLAHDHDVVGVDNFVSGPLRPGLEIVHLDVSSFADWTKLNGEKFDAVFHCAASFANELSVDFPLIDFQSNAYGTLLTLEFARRCGGKLFVYLGSSSSYGPGTDATLPFREDTPLDPQTPYAISKHVGEMYCRQYAQRFARSFTFRLFNVYGPGDVPGPYRNAIPNMVNAAVRQRAVRVFNPDATRDFTWIDDVAELLARATEVDRPGVYNICTGRETSVLTLAGLIAAEVGPDVTVDVRPGRPWDSVIRRVGDNARLREVFGDVQFRTIEQGIVPTVEWLLGKLLRAEAVHVA